MDVDCDINDCNWDWQGMEFDGPKYASSDVTSSLWSASTVTTNKEDGSCLSEEITPVKACGDLAYRIPCNGYPNKESKECRITSPRAKRRRTLEFSNEDLDFLFCRDEMSSSFLNTKGMEIPTEEFPLERLLDTSVFSECSSSTACEGLDLSCEEWLAECFNDAENNLGPDDMNSSNASDVEINISELINVPPDYEANTVQARRIPASGNVVVKKVKKSYFKAPPKLASAIAHPFALIEPCAVRGDVTLKDINQRIRPPPLLSLKNSLKMRMSCNGCRILRKGCSENCSIRPCLQWIKSPESQANATVFLAKFYGRAGLMNLINAAGPEHRPAIFRSLLYEACGRIVNPIYGSVGLLWSGSWQLCQSAVEAVLKGSPITQINSEAAASSQGPPLKAYDIRHVSKDDQQSADLHKDRT